MRNQVEFYNTPSGYVMCDDGNYTTRLSESSREVVDELLDTIRECYSDAYRALEQCYSKSSKNSRYQKFRIVNRFIRCNCGELDTQKIDFIDGNINIEQVHCPLRGSGDCQYENVICNPKRTSALTVRQLQIAAALAEGLTPQEVSDRLYISIHTVHNTIQAIKVKLDTLLIAIVMVTDTTTMKTRFQSAFRDVDMVFKVRKMVYEESKKQSKIYWFPINVFEKKED